MDKVRLAITGNPCAGKSTVSRHLRDTYGFKVVSSSFLVEEAAKQGIELKERSDFDTFQRQYRIERSATVMTDMLFSLQEERALNEGLRNRIDVDSHIERGGIILGLTCPLIERFRRRDPLNPKYPNTIGKFLAAEVAEYNNPDRLGSHTMYALSKAQVIIDTNQDIDQVFKAVDQVMKAIGVEQTSSQQG